jgi:hypothetical protein
MSQKFTTIPHLVEKWNAVLAANNAERDKVELFVSGGRFTAQIYRNWQFCRSEWLGNPQNASEAYAALSRDKSAHAN